MRSISSGSSIVRLYKRYKSVMQRWQSEPCKGFELTMPTHD